MADEPQAVAESVFDTPEDAIAHYLNGIVENDVGKVLAATASDEIGEGYPTKVLAYKDKGLFNMQDVLGLN